MCYLHFSGYRVEDLIKSLAERMKGRDGDVSYCFARLVGIAHESIEGNLGLGAWNQDSRLTESDSHGDAGCYVVNCDTWEVEAMGGYGKSFKARSDS